VERQQFLDQLSLELSAIGGPNPLSNFEASSFGQIDLARSHPGGLAQLTGSRASTITNLVRDGVAQARALSSARRIRNKSRSIERNFSIPAMFVAAGAVLTREGKTVPILLWRSHLLPKGDDFELRVDASPILNPALSALMTVARPDFRESDLMAVAGAQGELIPVSVLSLVTEVLGEMANETQKLLVLGNFVPDLLSLNQLGIKDSEPLKLLTGEGVQPEPISVGPIAVENSDSSQLKVLEKALSGQSMAVWTLPGAGYLQTVINLLANLALNQKRALLIAPRQQTLDEVAERLNQCEFGGLAIREGSVWADSVAAISRNEKAGEHRLELARERFAKAETEVKQYFDNLHSNENPLNLTLIEIIEKLADLAAKPTPPVNAARIKSEQLPSIRQAASSILHRAHEAGVFRYGPHDSPWFGSRFSSENEISQLLAAVKELSGEEFRTLSYQINRYLTDLNLKPCNSVEEWSVQLRLLLGIRETLDRFLPSIYDRPIHELITATAPRSERGSQSGAQRRRFKKLAKEYVRPGSSMPNLHASLKLAQEQLDLWSQMNESKAPPSVPLGLSDVETKFQKIFGVLEKLQRHLDPNPDIELLTRLSFEDLGRKFEQLASNTELLNRYIERLPLVTELNELGLQDLVRELCKVNPTLEQLELEFDLAWWQSALETLVQSNPKIVEYSNQQLAAMELEFEMAAAEVVAQTSNFVRSELSARWKNGIRQFPAQADQLRQLLRERRLTVAAAHTQGKGLWAALAPAILTTPYRVGELAPDENFDVVIVLDAASLGLAEATLALSKGSQLLAFGDDVIAAPMDFDTVARATPSTIESDRASVFDYAKKHLPMMAISRNYRTQSQVLGKYLNDNFYQNQIVLEPAVGQFFGRHNVEQIEVKEGITATSTIEGATESMDAEVNQVVELVVSHARWTPEESLMVVTASRAHAERIALAVEKEVASQPQLAEFFDSHGREGFECVSMSELTHRLADRVIFSVGFGRTPEGRISGSLGDFNSPNAGRWMVNQIVAARKRLTVVSAYSFEDFAQSLPENQRWLKDLIAPSFLSDVVSGDPDPLLRDLAKRLEKLGLSVRLNFAGRIGLAVSYGNKAAVVDADWSLVGDSWDDKLRLRPGLLRAMGWHYLRVHALELFARPQDVAHRIATDLGLNLEVRKQPLFQDKAFEDTNRAWGDPDDSNDDRLWDDKPPHWG
jgi:hypothetical protein